MGEPMPASALFELSLPADPAAIGTARKFVRGSVSDAGLSDEQSEDLQLAVSEACGAMIALREVAPADGPIRVRVRIEGQVQIRIEDLGETFSVRQTEPRVQVAPVSDLDTARVDLIAALFPETQVEATANGRMIITFGT